jgi:hypothetical protein
MKKNLRYITLMLLLIAFCPNGANAQKYSIKNRWNIKVGYSRNKTNEKDIPFMWPDRWGEIPTINKRLSNFRLELNYGVLNWLEVGIYGGFTHYRPFWGIEYGPNPEDFYCFKEEALAPTFGINVNFHLLPLFVKNEKCRWEWYLTAKYGGAFFAKWGVAHNGGYYAIELPEEAWYDPTINGNPNRYRHEYGAGMGGGVYFWNVFGLYLEVCGGQFSYFPDLFKSYYSIRGGIEFKITPKKKKMI